MTRLWIHHDAVFLFVSNHKFKKFASCPPSWSKRHQYAYVAWWEIFASLPQVHPYFKWRGWSWDFLGFEIFDSRILLGSKNWQVYFWVAWFKTKTGKSKLKTTTKLIITFGWPYQPSSGLQITIYYLHVKSENGQIERELFRDSSGFRFNVSFVDWTSVFVKSVLEASLNFTYIATITLRHIDNGVLQLMRKVMERVSPADFLRYWFLPPLDHPRHFNSVVHTLRLFPQFLTPP